MSTTTNGSNSNPEPKLRRGDPIRSTHGTEWQATLSDAEIMTIESDAGMLTLLGDGGCSGNGDDSSAIVSERHLFPENILSVDSPKQVDRQGASSERSDDALPRFVKRCPEEELDATRARLVIYPVPQFCRIEVLADMKRVATDCRRDFDLAAEPADAILQALREICPDATAEELRAVLIAEEVELHAKVARLGGWHMDVLGATAEIETWLELAKNRLFNLNEALINVE